MACAVLLPHVMRLNAEVVAEKYANIGRILCGEDMSQDEAVIAAIEYIENMNKTMNIPVDFKSWDITASAEQIARASMGGSMTGNPVPIDMEKAIEVAEKMYQRRNVVMSQQDKEILRNVYTQTLKNKRLR
jgi:alcohol dehydrogenase class IV